MSVMTQGGKPVEEFYKQVYNHLSLILNKVSCMEIPVDAVQPVNQSYRNRALDTFIRGLRGNLSLILGTQDIKELPQALYICQKLQNQCTRAHQANSYLPDTKLSTNNNPLRKQQMGHRPQFYPQVAYLPNTRINWHNKNNYTPNSRANNSPPAIKSEDAKYPSRDREVEKPIFFGKRSSNNQWNNGRVDKQQKINHIYTRPNSEYLNDDTVDQANIDFLV